MHPQLSPLTIGGTVLKESHDLVILGVTFNFKNTFEKHLRSVSKAASQRLGILKSWQVYHDRWPHRKLRDRVVSGANFLTGGVFECVDLWRHYVCCTRSGVTRCTLFMSFYLCRMCLYGLHAVLWSHFSILMRLLAAESCCTAGIFPPLSVSVELSC